LLLTLLTVEYALTHNKGNIDEKCN
jgi:hypothetical protein